MGSINIIVPGDIKLNYKLENNEIIDKIIQLIKNTEEKQKKKTKKEYDHSEVVGIWRDRFPAHLSSGEIQEDWRAKTWKRY